MLKLSKEKIKFENHLFEMESSKINYLIDTHSLMYQSGQGTNNYYGNKIYINITTGFGVLLRYFR